MAGIRILIVEDEPLVAEDIAESLQDIGYEVADIVHSGEEAIDLMKDRAPDAVLLDITLAGNMDGLEVASFIIENIQVPFIFLTSHADRATIERVKKTRPAGYLVKPFDEHDLLTAIELAMNNYFILHPPREELTLEMINAKIPDPLSDREFEVLMKLKDGKSNAQLAETLFLSVNTVKTHLKHIYEKLDVSNRTEALFRFNQLLAD